MKRLILVHYSEIGLKKSNKRYFVNKLKLDIKKRLEKKFRKTFKVLHVLSRILVEIPEDVSDFSEMKLIVERIFGIRNFQFVYEAKLDFDFLAKSIWENLPLEYKEDSKNKTFRVRVKRSQPFEMSSIEMEREIGAHLLRSGIDMGVRMKGADFVVNLELFNDLAYFSYFKFDGAAGMSSYSGGRLLSLISAGIDSPVAAYRMMRRGARVFYLHFHTYPFSDMSEIDNVKKIVEVLSLYQFDSRLVLCPFIDVQKAICANFDVPKKLRVVLYRRYMLRIAEIFAKKFKAKGLITGDSYAQVASQTSDNLFAVHDATSIPLFQPLISFDKEEIIKDAKKIGTYDLSALPCSDTCAMFSPEHPEISANVYDLREYEDLLDMDKIVDDVISNSEIIDF